MKAKAKTIGKFIIGAFLAPIAAVVVIISFAFAIATGILLTLLTALIIAVGGCVGFVFAMINDEKVGRSVISCAKSSLRGFVEKLIDIFEDCIN